MTGVLFIGGMQPPYEDIVSYLSSDAMCVAADSGYDYASAHSISISCIIGDMDSVGNLPTATDISIVKLRRDKDFTDTEIGLAYLKEQGCTEFTVIGGGGGRLDHLLQLCRLFSAGDRWCSDWHNVKIPTPHYWLTDSNVIVYVAESQSFCFSYDATDEIPLDSLTVSIFPCPGYATYRCVSDGLFWPLDNVCWKNGETSMSNKPSATQCRLTVEQGAFLCILPLKGWNR